MDAWPRNFTQTVIERTKLKGGTKKGLNGGPNSKIFNKRNIANLNAQTWKVGWPC
jgi:hypothetical protein